MEHLYYNHYHQGLSSYLWGLVLVRHNNPSLDVQLQSHNLVLLHQYFSRNILGHQHNRHPSHNHRGIQRMELLSYKSRHQHQLKRLNSNNPSQRYLQLHIRELLQRHPSRSILVIRHIDHPCRNHLHTHCID